MRLTVDYTLDHPVIPRDYRSGFMSLIKKVVETAHPLLYKEYYEQRKLKPFTFSVFFPQLKGQENGSFNVGSEVRLTVSTHSLELATHLYNGLHKVSSFPFFNGNLTKNRITLRPPVEIKTNEVLFKTASPVLVSTKGNADWFLLPWQDGFLDGLRFSVNEIARSFLNAKGEVPLDFAVLERDGKVSVKRRVVSHYNQSMSAMVGAFQLKSNQEILQLIYDVGLGVRRSQGFGMLEVVKQ